MARHHVAVSGPVVACMQESFAEDWFWAARELPPLILPQSYPDDGVLCQLLASGPADPYETCSLFFVEAIHAATQRVWITSPYFIPDEAVFAALRLAVLRGVDVRLLLPSRPDHRILGAEYIRSGIIGMSPLRTSSTKINQLYHHLVLLPPTHSLRTVWGNPP